MMKSPASGLGWLACFFATMMVLGLVNVGAGDDSEDWDTATTIDDDGGPSVALDDSEESRVGYDWAHGVLAARELMEGKLLGDNGPARQAESLHQREKRRSSKAMRTGTRRRSPSDSNSAVSGIRTALLQTSVYMKKKCGPGCRDARKEQAARLRLESTRRAAAKAEEGYQHSLMELKRKSRQQGEDLKGKQRDWEIQMAKLERARSRAERLVMKRKQDSLEMEFRLWRLKEERVIRTVGSRGRRSVMIAGMWAGKLKSNGKRTRRTLKLNLRMSKGNRNGARSTLVMAGHDARAVRRNIKKRVRVDFTRNKNMILDSAESLAALKGTVIAYQGDQSELSNKIADMRAKSDEIQKDSYKARDAIGDSAEAIEAVARSAGKTNDEYRALLEDFAEVQMEHKVAKNRIHALKGDTAAFAETNKNMNIQLDQSRYKLKGMMEHFERKVDMRIEQLKQFLTSGDDQSGDFIESALTDMLDEAKQFFDVDLPNKQPPASDGTNPKDQLLASHGGDLRALIEELATGVTKSVKARLSGGGGGGAQGGGTAAAGSS